jgi:hypothetical protein
MQIADNLAEAIACIKAHPDGRLATKYRVDGRCSWAYKWAGGWDAWRFQADDPHPAIAHKFLPDYHGLPECYARWEEAVLSATGDSVYRTNAFEL